MIHMGVGELLFWWILAIQSLLSSSVSKIHDVAEDKMSPSIITLTTSNDLLARKWLDQWPIGNGKFGALVGGSIEGDIIPLSMAGFYVIEGSVGPKHDSSFLYQQFDESRKELMNGNFQESQKKLSNLISKTPLGMFQYISDISLLLSPSPLILQQPAILKVDKNAVGRKKLWITHKNLHKFPKNNGNYNFGNLNSSHVTLDTKIGISKSSFRVVNHSEKSVRLYSRVWFASSIDDVIVGKLQCRYENIDEFNNSINNCLHLSLRFSRYINKREDLMPESKYIIQRYNSNSLTNTDIMFGNLKIPKNNIVSFELNLTPTPKSHHKDVVLCGVVICIPSFNSEVYFSNSDKTAKFVVCNSMRDSFILLSIQSTDRHFSGNSSSEKVPLIKEKCWKVIENAISLGHTKLRKRHIHSFSQHMTASDITFSHPDSPTSSNSITKSSFASHLTTMYWFNKYLLLSSASRSVSNLQGLWSDGPWNPWSSDYHLNINLQMMYWPTFAFGLHNTISLPLIEFLKDISITGRIPARNLYNSSGWVAHGFTDEYLNVGIRGDLQWALCVTCGSWIALYLWDYLLYSDFSLDFTINTFLPIFSTMIEFYFNYLFLGPDNYIHTGPTTSPENSYSGYSTLLNRKIIQYLTFSPAIDMSILRQVANSYSMAIQWSYYSIHKDEKKNKKILDSHSAIAQRFTTLIRKMKNSANPIVSDATGLILEYPTDLLPLTSSNSLSHSIKVDEIFDQGHRHFSSFHWLYPGVFHPHLSSSLLQATKATMTKKIQSGGGHTGWSAAWEISLWSRLRESQSTEKAMKKLLSKYVTRNLFGLHPKLAPNKQNCVTCYGPFSSSQIPHGDTEHRGMTTADASVFQMDANSGMAAGLHEMIYQSHIPSLLIFLPTIIPELSSGRVRNLASRGGYFVTFSWSSSRIQHISLNFQYWHPWFLPQYENFPGFFSTNQKTEQFTSSSVQFPVTENILTLVTPNPLEKIVFQPLHCGLVVERQQSDIPSHVTSPLDSYTHLKIQMFPCQVFLCSHDEILECRI